MPPLISVIIPVYVDDVSPLRMLPILRNLESFGRWENGFANGISLVRTNVSNMSSKVHSKSILDQRQVASKKSVRLDL